MIWYRDASLQNAPFSSDISPPHDTSNIVSAYAAPIQGDASSRHEILIKPNLAVRDHFDSSICLDDIVCIGFLL
jgi:hypothetical protein